MISYIIGKITYVGKNYIILESHSIGYLIYVANNSYYLSNEIAKVFIYKNININNKNKLYEEMYGFRSLEEKELFIKLLAIPGIGPKTANGILINNIEILNQLLVEKNIEGLCELENINEKIAKILIDNIKITQKDKTVETQIYNDLIEALKTLGYDSNQISVIKNNINFFKKNKNTDLSNLISLAIKEIMKSNNKIIEKNGYFKTH